MKKTIILLILILAVVFTTLSYLGSGGEYGAEKLFYRAMKLNGKILANPDVAPPAMVADVEKAFTDVLKKYPKTNTAKTAGLTLVEFYIYNKKYDEARERVKIILDSEKTNKAIISSAQFLKGNIYEKQGDWHLALGEYTILRDKYSDTQLGLQIPLYIMNYYAQKKMQSEFNGAADEAIRFYKKIESENKDKMIGYAALNMLLAAHLGKKDYAEVGTLIEYALDTYPPQLTIPEYLRYIDYIYIKELKSPERAIAIYRKIKGKAEDSRLKEALDKKITEIKNNVTFKPTEEFLKQGVRILDETS